MNKKLLLLIFVTSILLINSLQLSSAFFFWSHEKFVIQEFDEISDDQSATVKMCRPYLNILIDGDLSSDVGVIHYGSSGASLFSYIYPHTLQGYNECLRDSGSDDQLKCFCTGNFLHILQDSYSHNKDGIVYKYLIKYFGNNYLGHMIVEKNFQTLHEKYIEQTNPTLKTKIDENDKQILNSLFPEFGGDDKYLNVMQKMSGLNMKADAQLIRSGYLGEGFYNTVYKDKTQIPVWGLWVSYLTMFIGFLSFLLLLIFGKTKWKYLTAFIFLLLFLVGFITYYSFNPVIPIINKDIWSITGVPLPTWKITTMLIEIPPKFGYLKFSQQDLIYYDNIVQEATNNFLRNPVANIQDASGLTYQDANTKQLVQGSLTYAERGFSMILLPIITIIISWIMITLLLKSFAIKFKRRWYNPYSWFNGK